MTRRGEGAVPMPAISHPFICRCCCSQVLRFGGRGAHHEQVNAAGRVNQREQSFLGSAESEIIAH